MTAAVVDPWAPVEGKCNARKTSGTGLCRNGAGKGTDHPGIGSCLKHLGNSPNHRAHAASVLLERQVAELLEEYRPAIEGLNGTVELLGALQIAVGMRRVFEALVAGLGARDLWGPDHLGDARPHVAETRLAHWTTESARISKMAVDAGVEERQILWLEQQADQLVAATLMVARAALVAAGVAGELVERVMTTEVPAAMREAFLAIEIEEAPHA